MRTMTLRGEFTMADHALSGQIELFRYEANDLSKGWIVEAAYIWPKTIRAAAGSAHGHLQVAASLQTDEVRYLTFPEVINASDNRQMGWCETGYLIRNASDDFLSNGSNPPNPSAFLIDPEHVVANGLWLQAYSTSDTGVHPTRQWNYMVVLRPKKMDPKETILHLIKNVAQDVVN